MLQKCPKIVVIGPAYIDMAVKVEQIPSANQTVNGAALSYNASGPGPGQAVQAALCGCGVSLVSKTGNDPFGDTIIAGLAWANVNTDFVFTAKAKNTGTIVTLVDEAGKNAVCRYDGANTALNDKDIVQAEQAIADAEVCLVHARLPEEAVVRAVNLAKLHGTKVILNPARPISVQGRPQQQLPMECFNVDVLVANFYEAADIAVGSAVNIRTAKMIGSDLVARGAGCAVITLGRRGCVVVDRQAADHIPAFQVELADQAGRGDAFAGAIASYYAVKNDVREAAKFASAAGALACTKFGSIEALPEKSEIIQLLQRQDLDDLSAEQ